MEDRQFRQLLDRFDLSWEGYRKVRRGVKKRISRHMQQVGCRTFQAYLSALEQSHETREHFERIITVSISRFFRDQGLWEVLEQEILPRMIREERNGIYVWSAGCACGEEVYSLKILWDVVGKLYAERPKLRILATDIDPLYLSKAEMGIYRGSSLKEMPVAWRSRYFTEQRKGRTYALAQEMKEEITWSLHNLFSDSPDSGFQLIFLRNNLLTYYRDERRRTAFLKIIDTLMPGGFLVVGMEEKMPSGAEDLVPYGGCSCLWEKRKR